MIFSFLDPLVDCFSIRFFRTIRRKSPCKNEKENTWH